MAGDRPGRKPKLTKETEKRLLALLQAGVPREVACAGVGIASRTLRIWMTRAANGEPKFVEFADKVEQAQAKAQADMLVQIRRHGARDWRAPAWLLERCFRERYGLNVPPEKQEVEPVQVTIHLASDAKPAPALEPKSEPTAGSDGS